MYAFYNLFTCCFVQISSVQKVRIETFNQYLYLAEVEVYDDFGEKIDSGITTRQSSNFDNERVAQNGVDGNKETLFVTQNSGGEYLYFQYQRQVIILLF